MQAPRSRTPASRFYGVPIREIRLFAHALRLGLAAQQITNGTPVEEMIGILLSKKRLPKNLDSGAAILAAARAGRRLETLGKLNSCLIRTLIAGTLLADREGMTLRLGFQKGETPEETPTGHAWLTLGSQILPYPSEATAPNGEPYLVMASFPMRRPS